MTSLARLVALFVATLVLFSVCGLLFAIDQREAAIALGAVTFAGLIGGLLMAAGSIPRHRIPSPDEHARIGRSTVVASALSVLLGASYAGLLGDVLIGTTLAVMGAAQAALAAGMLNEARMLRLVPTLLSHDEEPRALALGANGMPGRARSLVVATDDRIVWAEGRRLRDRHAIRLADMDRFDADQRTGTLTVVGGGEALRVRPVPKPELERFEQLLRGTAAPR